MSDYFYDVDALFTNDETSNKMTVGAMTLHDADPDTFRNVAILSQFLRNAQSTASIFALGLDEGMPESIADSLRLYIDMVTIGIPWYTVTTFETMEWLIEVVPQTLLPITESEWMEVFHILGWEDGDLVDMMRELFA